MFVGKKVKQAGMGLAAEEINTSCGNICNNVQLPVYDVAEKN
jgi:hypothetical protein